MPDVPRSPRRSRKLGALVAAAALLVTAGCTGTGADEPTRTGGQIGYVEGSGNLAQIPPDRRTLVPEVTGPELGGEQTLSTRGYGDKVVVVNVWGSWCSPCRQEAPDLQAASERTADRAQFLGIDSKDKSPEPAEAFVRAFGITYPSIYDPNGKALLPFAGELPPSAIPSTLVLDAQGRLAVRILGPISESTLVTIVDEVAAGR